ncbi:MAG: DNA-3-methyladenine glycosylase I [Phycisphaerales bacterium]|nr:DNA-3-methyladenine glycosylase I [Phycisphaerales bacterium]
MSNSKQGCTWPSDDALMIAYHDHEWGVPIHDDQKLFEFLVLEVFQAGLSWRTILHKRNNFRKAFDNFNAKKIAKYTDQKVEELMQDAGIVRNRLKILATIKNAQCFLEVQKEFGSFDAYIWQFSNGKTIHNKWVNQKDLPAKTAESDAMSKDLLKRGFKFVGSTICYAHMQATGMVNDHVHTCPKHKELQKK